ncbi:MAG: hypothetical protein WJU30_00019 [Candidatus Phytoplasma pruni]
MIIKIHNQTDINIKPFTNALFKIFSSFEKKKKNYILSL